MNDKVLIVSPHPDDETLGAGGAILKYKELGCKVYWLNMTDIRLEYDYDTERVKKRREEIEAVCKTYDFDGFHNLELRPASLDVYSKS